MNYISKRLDRYLANSQWIDWFFQAVVTHGSVVYFDHLPIWLELEGSVIQRSRKKVFQFEAMWVGERCCEQILESS